MNILNWNIISRDIYYCSSFSSFDLIFVYICWSRAKCLRHVHFIDGGFRTINFLYTLFRLKNGRKLLMCWFSFYWIMVNYIYGQYLLNVSIAIGFKFFLIPSSLSVRCSLGSIELLLLALWNKIAKSSFQLSEQVVVTWYQAWAIKERRFNRWRMRSTFLFFSL